MNTLFRKLFAAALLLSLSALAPAADYPNKYIPRPDFEAPFKELEKALYVAEGPVRNPRSLLYVIYDANCPYCHLAWKMFQPYEKAGLQVRWVPVAFLSPTSMPKAIEALAAPDPTAAFRRIMENFGQNYDPPAGLDAGAKPDIAAKIQSNLELMQKFGITGTPGVIWKNKNGKVFVKVGLPRLSELPAMTGLPEQKVDDPELAKFR